MTDPNAQKFLAAVRIAVEAVGADPRIVPPDFESTASCPDCEPFGLGGLVVQDECTRCDGRGWVHRD